MKRVIKKVYPQEWAIFIIYLFFAIRLLPVQTQTFSLLNLLLFFLGLVTTSLTMRTILLFTKRSIAPIAFMMWYSLLSIYYLRTQIGFEFSVIADNLSLLLYKESASVVAAALNPFDYLQLLIILVILITFQWKKKLFSSKITFSLKAIVSPLIVIALLFIQRYSFDLNLLFGKTIISYFNAPSIELPQERFPYIRTFTSKEKKRSPHVFLITVESFSADLFNEKYENGKEYTPFMNKLMSNGWEIKKFYGQSVQTAKGQLAIYCGMIPLTQKKVFKHYPRTRVRCIPHVLKEHGYTSFFFKAYSKIYFDNTDQFAKQMGFDHIHAMDTKFISKEESKKHKLGWGIRDDIFYQKFFEYVDKVKEDKSDLRIFAGLTTITSHGPFYLPKKWRHISKDPKGWRDRYKNTLYLTDLFLKRFFEEIDKRDYLKDSIVIITGDHAHPLEEHNSVSTIKGFYEENFRTPLFFYGSGISKKTSHGPYSQVDLAPTLLDLLGINYSASFMGNSFIEEGKRVIPLVQPYQGRYVGVIQDPLKCLKNLRSEKEICFNLEKDPKEKIDIIDKVKTSKEYQVFKDKVQEVLINDVLIHKDRIWNND